MNKITFLICCLFLSSSIFGQLDISLSSASVDNKRECYQISITNNNDTDVSLLGQNYRLYYDSDLSVFDEQSLKSFLPAESYTDMKVVEHYYDVDASDFGPLKFEGHMGFVNIAVDFKDELGSSETLSKDVAFNVAEICFDNLAANQVSNIVWASQEITANYATAFVEVSINDANSSKASAAKINELRVDLENRDLLQDFFIDFYPNPFSSKLHLDFDKPLDSNGIVEVSNVFGSVIKVVNVDQGQKYLELDGQIFTNGAYLIKVHLNSGLSKTIKALKIQ